MMDPGFRRDDMGESGAWMTQIIASFHLGRVRIRS
jgi:hypothetical protein